ncbi:MAG: helix-turn-helix transcriptional regulator [Clostridia bacterium]|nr:helix-turn-helix transcriptional regulator [Clostridia bacterium]
MKMSEKIFHCRQREGLSQEALAERLGVSRQAVSRWECGETTPEPAKILLIARTFGVTADWLLDDEQAITEPQTLESPLSPPTEPNHTLLIPPPRRRNELVGGIILLCVGLVCLAFFGVVMLFGMRLTAARTLNVFLFPLALICLVPGIVLSILGLVYILRELRRKNEKNP